MTYCLNPHCSNPHNPEHITVCQNCGGNLFLGKNYRAIRLIGQGGFGRTLLGQDDFRVCVIKQFYPENSQNRDFASQLFQQEVKRLQELGEHPQIPDFYDYLEQDGYQYIIQEFVDGSNLAQELTETGLFGETQIKNLLVNLLPVIKFVHENNVIHRDIKPQNIIHSRQNNQLFLVDFGAAKYTTNTNIIKTGTVIGSAEYIAPEQLRGKAIFASDIYSLGVTCLYLITGISPFELFDITENEWGWRDYVIGTAIGEKLGNILDKMVSNALKKRYQSVDEILKDLSLIVSLKNQKVVISNYQDNNGLVGHFSPITALSFHPHRKILASGSENGEIKLWRVSKGQEIASLNGHWQRITALRFSLDGSKLISSSWDNLICIWQWQTGSVIAKLRGHSNWVSCLTDADAGEVLISGSYDQTIKRWKIRTGKEIDTLRCMGYQNWVTCLMVNPTNPNILVSGHSDNTIKIWDLNKKRVIGTLIGHTNRITSLAFSADGNIIVSASADKTVKLWDGETRQKIQSLYGHTQAITSVLLSADRLITSSEDKTIKLWHYDLQAQKISTESIATLAGHTGQVNAIALSYDHSLLASGSDDETIRFWQF